MSDHPISDEALDEDIAILGRKGGGKSYTAKGIVERLLDMGRRVLVLDPLGVWAGLRTSADGEHAGYAVAIFGGLHGDLPLDPAAAEPLARIIAAENLPAVIDLSELSKSAQQAFLLKFLHELRRANHEALTVVLEDRPPPAPAPIRAKIHAGGASRCRDDAVCARYDARRHLPLALYHPALQ